MVVAAAPEAARAGQQILARGGNAVDAAIATALALAVVYPQAGNMAGGGLAVLRTASGELHALDFRETAPAATWGKSFVDARGEPVADASTLSGLAVGVPGTLPGLEALHRRFGRLPWARLVEPAETLARKGFRVPEELAADLRSEKAMLGRHAATRAALFKGGEPAPAGTLLTQSELAETLAIVSREGAAGLHRGPLAKALVLYVRQLGGVLSLADLEGYAPTWRTPIVFDHGPFRVVTMPLPSTGGFLLQSILSQLASRGGYRYAVNAPETIHLVAEAERRAFADRNRHLGDSDCHDVPLAALLSPSRQTLLASTIDERRATPSSSLPAPLLAREHEETTHLSVATADGAAVSLTYTLNGSFGNGAVVPGVGVLLNNEMDDFATAPGKPNLYGLVQGETNAVLAGARPLSSMTPTIVLEEGRPRFVLGSPGGSTIPTTVLQVFLDAGPGGLGLAEAVAAARFHHQHLPDQIDVERAGFPPATLAALRRLGHEVHERQRLGLVHAISFERNGTLVGVADPRGYGIAAGR